MVLAMVPALAGVAAQAAAVVDVDGVATVDTTLQLNEISVSALKQGGALAVQPVAATVIAGSVAEDARIESMKGISALAPNLYIPDYGSRITSTIYVRGIGARIDNPSMSLNVDNLPVLNKNNYDFNVIDIARVEMLRGAQSQLYGRNAMAGVMNIYTLSPLDYQGVRLMAQGGNGSTWRAAASWYTKPSSRLGFSLAADFYSTAGFYRNEYNNSRTDWERSGSLRSKLEWIGSGSFRLSNVVSLAISRQGGYPYAYTGTGLISHNDTCFYRRTSLADALTMRWRWGNVELSSITSYQYLNDNMTLDQDFLPLPYFTLTQATKEHSLTDDFMAKGRAGDYSWIAGLFAFWKGYDMSAPVTFYDDGIANLIERHRNEANPDYPIRWGSRVFPLYSDFDNSNFGLSAYHQSSYKLSDWEFALGVRLEYERNRLNYNSRCYATYDILDATTVPATVYRTETLDIDDRGRLAKNFVQLLPKLTVNYALPTALPSNLYLSVGKGSKSGGFNTQMFSDVLQQRVMGTMGIAAAYDVDAIVAYKPEWSVNTEVGTHLQLAEGRLELDAALFYIYLKNQQLTMFPPGTTTGRVMTNAGRSRSLGAELSIDYRPVSALTLSARYGYTDARFIEFFNGKSDFSGKHLPYAPASTLYASAGYRFDVEANWLRHITFAAHLSGVGRIWWNEDNSLSQPFYALLGLSATFANDKYSLQLWGENITNTRYDTFYFVSMSNAFLQRGKKPTFGVTLRVNI